MASDSFLMVCESFYSIQGEGPTAGKPAVFLRLTGCNLRCNGFSYQDPETGKPLGCDSKLLWLSGKKRSFQQIIDFWSQKGWWQYLQQGAHLIVTGGEPLLQQSALTAFFRELHRDIYIEIETNGTQAIHQALQARINQFNVSPKLTNSGELASRARDITLLGQYAQEPKTQFKFVIAQPEDITEVIEEYVQPLQIKPERVWLMPEGGTKQKIDVIKPWLVEQCKQHLFNFTSRLQIDIWGEVTGV